MIRYMIICVTVIILFCTTALAAETKPETVITQKDFARMILQQYSWGDGLPIEPSDRDYLQILGGKRKFRYEAESAYNEKTDRVTVREFALYGPYTGKGWLMGVSDVTIANFSTLLPIKGTYTLKAVIKGNGFVWNVDNKPYRADSNSEKLREIEIGKIPLKAGVVNIQVSIPPEGAIDSFSFTAADYPPIQPFNGWRFKEPLTAGRMAEIAVSITGTQEQLPESTQALQKQISAVETAVIPPTAARTDAGEFGKFYSREWVRADYRGAAVQIPVKINDAGFYAVNANLMGGVITGSVNEVLFESAGKPYLDKVRLGMFRMESGDNLITINLPPMGGIDTLKIRKSSIAPDDFLKLSGVKGPADRVIMADEAKTVLKSIADSYTVRK